MIVLASASPRRRALLEAAGIAARVDPADVDETLVRPLEPAAAALLLAERKARAVEPRYRGRDAFLVAADTIVALRSELGRWELLGKPRGSEEAAAMLGRLSGSRHCVVTGVAVLRTRDGRLESDAESTWVTMRPLERDEVAAYVASGEWRDKAGGYAIQETADAFVTALEGGGFDNVVGLPVPRTLGLLRRLGAPGLAETPAEG